MKLWIARNEDLRLIIFPCKPNVNLNKITGLHYWTCYNAMEISPDRFPEVTFENSPQEVEIKLVNEIVGVAESPSKTFQRVNMFETGASYRR